MGYNRLWVFTGMGYDCTNRRDQKSHAWTDVETQKNKLLEAQVT